MAERRIARTLYAPFIVEGPATWSDTWRAPRYAGGYHPHQGQDVLCRFGAPVLAVQAGTVRFGWNPLGGRSAYLDPGDGSFWYYAHLKSYAAHLLTGDRVRTGDVIGSCGVSGDATLPHVHFGYFTAGGEARDPMRSLVRWLRDAERRLARSGLYPRPPRQTVTAPIPPRGRHPVGEAERSLESGASASGQPRDERADLPLIAITVPVIALGAIRVRQRSAFFQRHRGRSRWPRMRS